MIMEVEDAVEGKYIWGEMTVRKDRREGGDWGKGVRTKVGDRERTRGIGMRG